MNIRKMKNLLLIGENYRLVIDKISGIAMIKVKSQDNQESYCLSIFFDGIKIDFFNEKQEIIKNAYDKITEIIIMGAGE